MIKQKFKNITNDDFSVYPIQLREILVNELHRAYDKSDDLTVPILDAIENMLKEVDYDLSNIVRTSGMYSIYKYDNHYAVNYIENKPNKTPDRSDDIAYVFSEESFYNKSILYFILQSYGHNLTVMEYLQQYESGYIPASHKKIIDTSVEIGNNLITYLKKEKIEKQIEGND